ncbi:MAG: hypothetical protein JXQ75_03775 [Phycisphaerae bacterium]|nr:hypothetical protein [Phycisphaerae bacterium]
MENCAERDSTQAAVDRQGAADRTGATLSITKSTVYRVAGRLRQQGEVGMLDRREDNGDMKLDECYLSKPDKVVWS